MAVMKLTTETERNTRGWEDSSAGVWDRLKNDHAFMPESAFEVLSRLPLRKQICSTAS